MPSERHSFHTCGSPRSCQRVGRLRTHTGHLDSTFHHTADDINLELVRHATVSQREPFWQSSNEWWPAWDDPDDGDWAEPWLRHGRHHVGPPSHWMTAPLGRGADVLLFSRLFTASGWCRSDILRIFTLLPLLLACLRSVSDVTEPSSHSQESFQRQLLVLEPFLSCLCALLSTAVHEPSVFGLFVQHVLFVRLRPSW